MSFFKDFKEDFSQAVNELMSAEDLPEENENDMVVNTLEQDVDAQTELDKLEGLLEEVAVQEKPAAEAPKAEGKKPAAAPVKEEPRKPAESHKAQPKKTGVEAAKAEPRKTGVEAAKAEPKPKKAATEAAKPEPNKPAFEPAVKAEKQAEQVAYQPRETVEVRNEKEDIRMNTEDMKETLVSEVEEVLSKEVSDEVTVITEGTSISGNMQSIGSIEVRGKVVGDVECNGKLTVTGVVRGNSNAAEFFADAAKIEGEIKTDGTVKIGLGSVVIGNIAATSAVIAGAIKGDIDVQGPVVVDTSAVVMGNIKSRSVQINNGAVIEGFCSQCYAEVDVNKLFD